MVFSNKIPCFTLVLARYAVPIGICASLANIVQTEDLGFNSEKVIDLNCFGIRFWTSETDSLLNSSLNVCLAGSTAHHYHCCLFGDFICHFLSFCSQLPSMAFKVCTGPCLFNNMSRLATYTTLTTLPVAYEFRVYKSSFSFRCPEKSTQFK